MSTKANEPAFPNEPIPGMGGMPGKPGLTKREYFAGLAMQSAQLIALECARLNIDVHGPADIAKAAVRQADALLEELSK